MSGLCCPRIWPQAPELLRMPDPGYIALIHCTDTSVPVLYWYIGTLYWYIDTLVHCTNVPVPGTDVSVHCTPQEPDRFN